MGRSQGQSYESPPTGFGGVGGGAVHEGQNRVLCTSPSKVNSFSGSVSVTRKTGRFILLVILNGNRKANMDYLIMSEDKFGNEKCQKFFSKMVSLEMFSYFCLCLRKHSGLLLHFSIESRHTWNRFLTLGASSFSLHLEGLSTLRLLGPLRNAVG